jgi:GAF domain-containing protein
MPDGTELADFSEMALELHAEPTPERTIERIVEWAQRAASCSDAGIMLVHARHRIETAVATSRRVAEAHDLQVALDEGPCLEAILDARPYLTGDAKTDDRFPKWGPAVAELGYNSVLSVLLATQERRYGSLNLYAEDVDAFDEDDLAVTQIFSRHASVALAAAHHRHGLQVAIDARKLIGQAQGILMERYDIDADRAFDFLRRQSQDHNIKLRAVADWVVNTRNGRSPSASGADDDQRATS